jgi:hypothetical protein
MYKIISAISGPFLCFRYSKPVGAIGLGDDGIRIQGLGLEFVDLHGFERRSWFLDILMENKKAIMARNDSSIGLLLFPFGNLSHTSRLYYWADTFMHKYEYNLIALSREY